MLFGWFVSPLVEVDNQQGDEVEGQEDILEGGVSQT